MTADCQYSHGCSILAVPGLNVIFAVRFRVKATSACVSQNGYFSKPAFRLYQPFSPPIKPHTASFHSPSPQPSERNSVRYCTAKASSHNSRSECRRGSSLWYSRSRRHSSGSARPAHDPQSSSSHLQTQAVPDRNLLFSAGIIIRISRITFGPFALLLI